MKLINENPTITDGRKPVINGSKLVELEINGKKELHYIHKDTLAKLKEEFIPEEAIEKSLDEVIEAVKDSSDEVVEKPAVEKPTTFVESIFGKSKKEKKDKKKK